MIEEEGISEEEVVDLGTLEEGVLRIEAEVALVIEGGEILEIEGGEISVIEEVEALAIEEEEAGLVTEAVEVDFLKEEAEEDSPIEEEFLIGEEEVVALRIEVD